MARIVDYFEEFDRWGRSRAFEFLYSEKLRLGEDVRFEPGGREERLIARNDDLSFRYARDFIKGRFELGEPAIAKSARYSYLYARDVIKGRFELGEPAIAKDDHWSFGYARDVIKGRFKIGERAIAGSAHYSCLYAMDIIKGRFELGEPEIAKFDAESYIYARDVIKGRFPAGEWAIISSYVYGKILSENFLVRYLSLLKSTNDPYYGALFRVKEACESFVVFGDKELTNLVRVVL